MAEKQNKNTNEQRQDWRPHWSLETAQKAGKIALSVIQILGGALVTVLLIGIVCGFVFAGILGDYLQKDILPMAGMEIVEARINYLAYAPEIAAVMLQRQQASAIIDARKMIVDGAVGMVEMALDRLQEDKVVDMDEERKAQMVSNLLVVLCGSNDAQPIVNTGSIY